MPTSGCCPSRSRSASGNVEPQHQHSADTATVSGAVVIDPPRSKIYDDLRLWTSIRRCPPCREHCAAALTKRAPSASAVLRTSGLSWVGGDAEREWTTLARAERRAGPAETGPESSPAGRFPSPSAVTPGSSHRVGDSGELFGNRPESTLGVGVV